MGSYVLGSRIGAGGMGEVWQATHRFLARPSAIKLIKPDVLGAMTKAQGDVLVQRFRREARAAAMLRSPHTIQLYDFGVASDGTFYYVMELLNGLDLQSLVSQYGPLPGRYVFTANNSIQLVARHVSSAPVSPSRHSAFDISPALDELVLRCLEKKPEERPGSARELCDELGRCEIEAAWTREDARLWWEKRMEAEVAVEL